MTWYWKKDPHVDILTISNEVPKSEPEEGQSHHIAQHQLCN